MFFSCKTISVILYIHTHVQVLIVISNKNRYTFIYVEPVPMPISPTSETGISQSSESRVSQTPASRVGISSQGAAMPTEAIQQEGIPELLPQSEVTLIFMKSCLRKNMSVHLTRRLFSEQVRMTSNVSGRNKRQLDPKVMSYIKSTSFKYFPSLHSDITKEWADCIIAIDESCRRLKNKPTKKKNEAPA